MKKIVKVLSIIILIISILIVLSIVAFNVLTVIRIMFFGVIFGSAMSSGELFLYGISGVKNYYYFLRDAVILFEIPMCIVCIIYQIVYFKIIRKKFKKI
jgi:hypothetical protein